jgi:ABC-type transporter Mla MlaB component
VFKVTNDQRSGMGVTLRLEGRLTAAWVDECARELASAMTRGAQVTLNLDGLSFADDRGVALIRQAIEQGVRCAGGSEFIGALLEEEQRR